MRQSLLDLYSDYLIASFSYTPATGLSRVPEGAISHDKITRFLAEEDLNSQHLWLLVKPTVRQIQSTQGSLLFDDTIQPKPFTDENELITWHWDHIANRSVKGLNLLSAHPKKSFCFEGQTLFTGFKSQLVSIKPFPESYFTRNMTYYFENNAEKSTQF